MKPIEVKNSHDCTVSVQVIQTEITAQYGTRPGPKEICLLIENEKGYHVALFTLSQADELIQALRLLSEQMADENREK